MYLPKDLRSNDSRTVVQKSIQAIQTRFPDGTFVIIRADLFVIIRVDLFVIIRINFWFICLPLHFNVRYTHSLTHTYCEIRPAQA